MKLRELAHSRTGDKGNTLNISVICLRRAALRASARATLTPERVKAHLARCRARRGRALRTAAPRARSISCCGHALGGGVTRSLALDAHGKSLSSALLDIEIDTKAGDLS